MAFTDISATLNNDKIQDALTIYSFYHDNPKP